MSRRRASGRLEHVESGELAPQSEEVLELPIPAGETWRLEEVGATDVGPPGQPGSSVVFAYRPDAAGSYAVLRTLAASNSTTPLPTARELEGGDGASLKIVRRSAGGTREVTAWVSGIVLKD